MSAHTKGPWRVEEYILPSRDNSPGDVSYQIVADREGYSAPRGIAATDLQPGDDDTGWLAEDEANARLIASAPRLLEALHEQIEPWASFSRTELEYWNRVGGIDTPTLMRIFAARAAIYEATGEAP